MNKQSHAVPGTSRTTKKPDKSPTNPRTVKKIPTASGHHNVTSVKDKQPVPKATKKAAAAPGTSAPGTSTNTTVIKKPTKQSPEAKVKKKTVLDLVCEAIEVVGMPRKGASLQAIKKYISSNAENGTKQTVLINRALQKGIEKGVLSRPNASKNMKGATGHFTLAKKEVKPKKKKSDEENRDIEDYVSDTEITKKPEKPRKRVLSDSAANKVPGGLTSTPRPKKGKKPAVLKDPENTKKEPVKKVATIKKSTKTTSENKNKPVESEASAKTTKESQKKTKASKPKSGKANSQAKSTRTRQLFNEAENKPNE